MSFFSIEPVPFFLRFFGVLEKDYVAARDILNQKSASSVGENLVDDYIDLWEASGDYTGVTSVIQTYYDGLNNPENFSEKLEEKLVGLESQLPESEKQGVVAILEKVSEQRLAKEKAVEKQKAVEEQSVAEEQKAAEEQTAAEEQKATEEQTVAEEQTIAEAKQDASERVLSELPIVTKENAAKKSPEETKATDEKTSDGGAEEFSLQAMMDSIEKYPLHKNPYFLESLNQYIDLINQSYENVGAKQTVTIVSMESVLKQAGLSKKTIEKIIRFYRYIEI